MIIEKVINNNIISTHDSAGREVVVMGRGIGFKQKPGAEVDESRAEKIFRLDNTTQFEQFMELLEKIPADHVAVTDEIITHAKQVLNVKLNPMLYVTLTDHISFAIERSKQNITLENALLFEIKSFYKQEYLLGSYAVDLINQRFGVHLGEDEAGFIALHFVNAEYGTEIHQAMNFPQQMRQIISIVENDMGTHFDESSLAYERFVTHIKFLLQRVYRHETSKETMMELSDSIRKSCPAEYHASCLVADYIEQTCRTRISEEEMIYLTIHIHRASGRKE